MNYLSIRRRLALEIARKMRNNLKELHPLKQLFWECTLRCNLHCKHCGSDCKRMATVKDMPAEDFLRTIDAITPYVRCRTGSLPPWLSVGHGLQWA